MKIDLVTKVALLKYLCSRLTGDQFKVAYILLLHFHNSETGRLFPSYRQMARAAHTSPATAVATMKRLRGMGLIEFWDGNKGGRQRRNNYAVNVHTAERLIAETFSQPNTNVQPDEPLTPETFSQPNRKRSASRTAIINEGINEEVDNERNNEPQSSFDEFWRTYPHKAGKFAARTAFAKALKLASAEEIISGARAYADQQRGRDPKFTAHAKNWLRDGRWSDDDDPGGYQQIDEDGYPVLLDAFGGPLPEVSCE